MTISGIPNCLNVVKFLYFIHNLQVWPRVGDPLSTKPPKQRTISINLLKTEQCDSTPLANVPRYQKQDCLFDGFQALPACPSDKNTIKIKMTVEHFLKDTDRLAQ